MALMLAALTTYTLAQATGSAPTDYQDAPVPVMQNQQGVDLSRYVPVVTSVVVPGTGQMLQGEWAKGLAHLAFCAACLAATQYGTSQSDSTMRLVGGVGLLGIGIWSPWDAFTHARQPHQEATP